jgi:hypothetical protein
MYFEQDPSSEALDSPALYLRRSETGGFQNSKLRIEILEMKPEDNIQI